MKKHIPVYQVPGMAEATPPRSTLNQGAGFEETRTDVYQVYEYVVQLYIVSAELILICTYTDSG